MPPKDCHTTCKPCKGNPFRYIDWTTNPTPFDTISPCSSKLDKKDLLKSMPTDESTKKTSDKYKSTEEEDRMGVENVPLVFDDLGLEEDFPEEIKDDNDEKPTEYKDTHVWGPEMDSELAGQELQGESDANRADNKNGKWWQRLLGSPRKDSRQKGSMWTDEHEPEPNIERGLQKPREMRLGKETDISETQRESPGSRMWTEEHGAEPDTERGLQKPGVTSLSGKKYDQGEIQKETQGLSHEMPEKDVQSLPRGAQGDTQALAEDGQKDAQALMEGAQGDAQSEKGERGVERKGERLAQRKKIRRNKRRDRKKRAIKKIAGHNLGQGVTEAKTPKELTLLDEEPVTPGDLDAVTKRQYEIDEMWYRVQTDRFMPQPTRPIAPHWRWHTTLKIKHFIQKVLNPLDTLRAGIYAKDMHGPLRGSVAWRGRAGGGWGCGCPALPCICHLHTIKPPKKIPRGTFAWTSGTAPSRLMERVAMRVRIEERLHEKLADLPPPHDQAAEPLFCLGVDKCVARQVMTKPLIEAAERTRREAMKRFPCDPECQAKCIIAYEDTVKMLRLQAAGEILGSNYVQVAKPSGKGITNVKFTSKKKDMKFIREKCAEIKVGAPFPTNAICYRVEEVGRAAGVILSRGARGEANGGGAADSRRPRPHPHRRATAAEQRHLLPERETNQRVEEAVTSTAAAPFRDHMKNHHIIQPTKNTFKGNSRQQVNKNGKEDTKREKLQMVITETEIEARATPLSLADGRRGGAAETQWPDPETAFDAKVVRLAKDATQSTTEISSSRVLRHREMSRRKTRWERYRDHWRDFRVALTDAKRTLTSSSNVWKLNNLKFWLTCCWLPPKVTGVVCSDLQEEDTYLHLAKIIQEEERYRNVLNLKNYLINHA